jgi:hypothetical protein
MSVSSLAIRIIFLLLPGAIASVLYWKLRGRATRKDWEDALEIIIFSIICYVIYALSAYLLSFFNSWWLYFGLKAKAFTYFQAFFDEKVSIDVVEVFYASMIGVPLALVAAYSYRYKTINKFGQRIGATTHYGDEDVWDFFHHSPAVSGNWVTVRDHKFKLNYQCWIQEFSDTGKERELLLREVQVYNDETGDCLYTRDVMYISRKNDELTIEATIVSPEMLGEELKSNDSENVKQDENETSEKAKEASDEDKR